jgi:tetratricopeptide (TPR) repeat protein
MARLVSRFGVSRYEADELYRIALDFYQKKNLSEALHKMDAAIQLFPNRAEYYAARGFFRLEDGDNAKAAVDFDLALSKNPYEVLANYGKGVIAYQAKEYEKGLDYFMKAWAAENHRPETLYYIAMILHRQKQNQKALQWMRQAYAIYNACTAGAIMSIFDGVHLISKAWAWQRQAPTISPHLLWVYC